MFDITTLRPEDHDQVEDLLDRAFGRNRKSKTSYRYRAGIHPVNELSLAAREGDRLVGSIQYWPVTLGGQDTEALLLGPLAIDPRRQGEGIGAALMFTSLDMAAWAGHTAVLLVGDLAYYRRFGFRTAALDGLTMPGEAPHRLLVTEPADHALAGVCGDVKPWRSVRRDNRDAGTNGRTESLPPQLTASGWRSGAASTKAGRVRHASAIRHIVG